MCLKMVDNTDIKYLDDDKAKSIIKKIVQRTKNANISWVDITNYDENTSIECYYFKTYSDRVIAYFLYDIYGDQMYMNVEIDGYMYKYDIQYEKELREIYDFMTVIITDEDYSNVIDVEYDEGPFEFKENINYNFEYLGL